MDNVIYNVGDCVADSRIWDDGEPSDETLDGTCCIGLASDANADDIDAALEAADNYFGDKVYLIAGDGMEYGEDSGEYVIRNAVVIAIIK